jgi:hypothetical protein
MLYDYWCWCGRDLSANKSLYYFYKPPTYSIIASDIKQ